MGAKKESPAQVQGQSSTHYKDNHFSQLQQVYAAFKERPMTMLECARKTGIERAGVCWYVRDLRKSDRIAVVKHGPCPITRFKAGFLTTDPKLFPVQPIQQTLF